MVFGQLIARDSMRDLILSLEAHQSKYYHLGFGPTISRRNLGTANEKRDCKIFEEFAYVRIAEARRSCYRGDFEIEIDGNVYGLDSTTIDLCLNIFWWAEFRKHKGGIKLHTLFDIKTSILSFLHISTAKVLDVNIMDIIPYEKRSFYVSDKGYTDFLRLHRIHTNGSFFVISAKDNLQFRRMYSKRVDKSTGALNDHIGKLVVYKSKTEYPEKLRRIKYYDSEHDLNLVFLTNNMDLSFTDIALLYKKRWAVELFFKWMKQHLKIKSFWGTTLNAVKIQMYCAVIAYCLVALVGYKLKVNRTIYEILQIMSISLLDKAPIREILTRCDYNNVKEPKNNQLIISGF
jgi:hypothetical protein